MSMLFTTSVMAERIEFIPTSTLGGPHGIAIRMITEMTKPAGFDFAPAKKSGCGEAVNIFNNAKGPVAITWSDTMYKNSKKTKQNCIINFKEAKAIAVFYAPYEVCVLPGTSLKANGRYKFGNNKFNPQVDQLKLINTNKQGMKFTTVTYSGSSKVLQGLLNKEVDIGIIATGNARSAIKAGSIKCLYTTGATKYGQQPLSSFYGKKDIVLSEFRLGVMIFVRNFTDEQISTLQKTLKSNNFVARLTDADMVDVKLDVTEVDIAKFKKIAKQKVNHN